METGPGHQDTWSNRSSPPAPLSLDIVLAKGYYDATVLKKCYFCNRAFSGSVHRCRQRGSRKCQPTPYLIAPVNPSIILRLFSVIIHRLTYCRYPETSFQVQEV